MISKKVTNGLFKLVMGIASMFDLKIAVILMRHKIKLETVHEDEKENDRYYDPKHYLNGNLYIEDMANPVDIEELEDKTQMISSEKYKKFFDIDILEKIAQVSKGSIAIKGWSIMIMLLVISTIINIFLFFILAG